jgi:hypothetical protein
MTTAITVNDILNRVAVEVGLLPLQDPYSSADSNFSQMRILLNIAGEELCIMNDWDILVRRTAIDTSLPDGEKGVYTFKPDYLRMVNQTMWDNLNQYPIPLLTAQEWALQKTYDNVGASVYARFRMQAGAMTFLPNPMPTNNLFSYEYISSNWVFGVGTAGSQSYVNFLTSLRLQLVTALDKDFRVLQTDSLKGEPTAGTDFILFDKTLITRYLKLKWLKAKGLDSIDAQRDFDQIFDLISTADRSGKILNASGVNRIHYPTFVPIGDPSNGL